jgi:succinate dehydrogenase / fumarate reductase cytochrome b subunit
MAQKNKRPVHLNLFKIRLPVTGIVSIFHRVTGVLLVLAIPLALFLLDRSLRDAEVFAACQTWLTSVCGQVVVWSLLALFIQHFYSGLRHLLLDIDIGVEKTAARRGAWLVFAASAITLAALFGVTR